jgi:AcrR family transcriptional regulator
MVKTLERRDRQRDALLLVAERTIAERGLSALKARDLAGEIGCSIGAIYNLVEDMDELVLRVGSRTLARLDEALRVATPSAPPASVADATEHLVAVALAYAAFARANLQLWRTLFEHRLPAGAILPDWAVAQQTTMFSHVLAPLRALRPAAAEQERVLLSRTLFAAVHGVVALGLDEKLVAVPRDELDRQVETLVRLVCDGLAGGSAAR